MADLNDKWIWLSFGLGVAYGGFAIALGALSLWIFNPGRLTVSELTRWTRTARLTLWGAALMWEVFAAGCGLGGVYYCINYLQQRFGENAQGYTRAFFLGFGAVFPYALWRISVWETRWRESKENLERRSGS